MAEYELTHPKEHTYNVVRVASNAIIGTFSDKGEAMDHRDALNRMFATAQAALPDFFGPIRRMATPVRHRDGNGLGR